jgi:hypothetical protein
MGKSIMVIGAIALFVGLLGLPPFADFLPVSFVLPSSDPRTYYRIVAIDPGSLLVPASLAATGSLLCGACFAIHRGRRRE